MDQDIQALLRKIDSGAASDQEKQLFLRRQRSLGREVFEDEFLILEDMSNLAFNFITAALGPRSDALVVGCSLVNQSKKIEEIMLAVTSLNDLERVNEQDRDQCPLFLWTREDRSCLIRVNLTGVAWVTIEQAHCHIMDVLQVWRQLNEVSPFFYLQDLTTACVYNLEGFHEEFCVSPLQLALSLSDDYFRIASDVWESKVQDLLKSIPRPAFEPFLDEDL